MLLGFHSQSRRGQISLGHSCGSRQTRQQATGMQMTQKRVKKKRVKEKRIKKKRLGQRIVDQGEFYVTFVRTCDYS